MKVFISHSSTDKKFVRTLKEDLVENNIEVWLDEDQLELGDSLSEKLQIALDESSHFLIILSPTSVNSEWVKFELEKALKNSNSQLLQKIIPIKYSDCNVPLDLKKLIYSDLSQEVRVINEDKVKFVTNGYTSCLINLCKSIRNSEKQLTKTDKNILIKEIIKEEKFILTTNNLPLVKASYFVNGYKDLAAKEFWANIILQNKPLKTNIAMQKVKPVLLPPLLKNVFQSISIGDHIMFSSNYGVPITGNFAGYRKDDLSITIDPAIRSFLSINKGARYNVEINPNSRTVTFIK